MSEPTIVDIYCRAAISRPGSSSLDDQEAACRAYCLEHDLTIGMIFREVASGLEYRNREGLTKLRKQYIAGQIQGIVATTLDRLSRSQVHLVILMEELEQYSVTFYAVKEQIDENPIEKLVRMALAFTAEVKRQKALDSLVKE